MNVTIIYGTMIKAITYNCVQLLLNNLNLNMNIKTTEFFLPKDLPSSYTDFNSHNINSKDTIIHSNCNDSITDSLNKSDLIILACPVSKCDISPNMKLLLNNIYYESIKNNTNSFMSNKIGLVMSTTAGAGLFQSTRTLKKGLNSLGVNNIFIFSETLYEMNWDYVNLKTKKQINEKISKLSNKISDLYAKPYSAKTPLLSKITFLQKQSKFKKYHHDVMGFKN